MICPYCDSLIRNLPDNRTCPQCGAPLGSYIREKQLSAPVVNVQNEQKEQNLELYYQKYKPDRLQAIMALRIDTGMSAAEAKNAIDLIFDFYESKSMSM